MATRKQRNSLLTLPRNRKIGKLFQKLLFPLFDRVLSFFATFFVLDGSDYCLVDLLESLLIVEFSEFVDFIGANVFIFQGFLEDGFCFLEFGIFGAFADFALEVVHAFARHHLLFNTRYQSQPYQENSVVSIQQK